MLTAASIGSAFDTGGRYLLVIPPLYFEQASLEIQTYLRRGCFKNRCEDTGYKPRKTGRALVFDHPTLDDVSAASHTSASGYALKVKCKLQVYVRVNGGGLSLLLLHQDAAHLAGNLPMGAMYGWMVSQRRPLALDG